MLSRSWSSYPLGYRAREMAILAQWLMAGQSGTVAGFAGAGKSNLLGFLCYNPEALEPYCAGRSAMIVPLLIDFNSLPSPDLANLYRIVLRTFYEARPRFDVATQTFIQCIFEENRTATDAFVLQTALRETFLHFGNKAMRVVLVMDRFDKFSVRATPEIADTLRGLRDSYKDSLCYIVGMRHEPRYLLDPSVFGELYELLDLKVCWVRPMNEEDARWVIAKALQTLPAVKNGSYCPQIIGLKCPLFVGEIVQSVCLSF